MSKLKQIFTHWRVIVLLLFVLAALVLIRPNFSPEGVAIRSVQKDSAAALAGMHGPLPHDKPMMREVITHVNGVAVRDKQHFYELVSGLNIGDSVRIESLTYYQQIGDKRKFSFTKKPALYNLQVKPVVTKIIDAASGNITLEEGSVPASLGIVVYDAPATNLRKGLDLEGGTRVILQPAEKVSPDDLNIILDNLKQRLNVYGLSDVTVRDSTDLEGTKYIIIEIAGANEDEIKELLSKQGKFEAKIGNDIIFRGGKDITYVCRSADCSFVSDPRRPCTGALGQGYLCSFSFSITLSPDAADRQAELTKVLPIVSENGYQYLNQSLDLYLDDEKVDSLRIGADLKGRPVTEISISGPGNGATVQEALGDSAKNMKNLQTLMITGSLPVKLDLVKVDTISPELGKDFIREALLIFAVAILGVAVVIYVRFRSLTVSTAIMVTMIIEIVLLLGVAALIGWNLDLAAIAGILIAIGTGVDDQIIISDEVLHRQRDVVLTWKERFKRAFYIIMAAYFITVVGMLPLLWAGAGLLKGFALTTIIGVTIGVFVTRPAFATVIEIILEGEEE